MLTLAVPLLTLAFVPASAVAQNADVVISAGVADRSYYAAASRLRTQLAQKTDLYASVLESRGSLENLQRLLDPESPVGLAFTQTDAIQAHLAAHPEDREQLEVLADVGKECGILVVPAASPIRSASDLKSGGKRRIAVGRQGSGAAVTWARLGELDAGFTNAVAEPEGAVEALARIHSGDPGAPDAVLFVQRPSAVSSALEVVIESPDQFRVVPFHPDGVSIPDHDGKPVYTIEKAKMRNLEFDALCTRGLLLVSTRKVNADVRHAISQTLLSSESYIIPGSQ